jgi:holo-[acyl-carrier protein] synthase
MTIFGIGSDILNRSRIQKTYEKFGNAFLHKIWTQQEYDAYATSAKLLDRLAKSFCAKEAFSKAYRTGIGKSFKFHDISVLRNESGAPYFAFDKTFPFIAHLSFADEGDIILAFVILENFNL